MNEKHNYRTIGTVLIMIFMIGSYFAFPADEPKTAGQKISQWLVLGPAPVSTHEKNLLKNDQALLNFDYIQAADLVPVEGTKVPWGPSLALTWKTLQEINLKSDDTAILYLATFLEPSRWLQTQLTLDNANVKVSAYLDGKTLPTQPGKDKTTANMDLTDEKHLLILKILLVKGDPLVLNAALENKEPFAAEKIELSLKPLRKLQPKDIINVANVNNFEMSPDGKFVALNLSKTKETGDSLNWFEILDIAGGNLIFSSISVGNISGFQWVENSDKFSYRVMDKEKTSLYLYHLKTHTRTPLLENIDKLSNYRWAPNYSFLVYSTYKQQEPNPNYKYIKEIDDRGQYSGFTASYYIYYPSPSGGTSHKISDFDNDLSMGSISPDSKKLVAEKKEIDKNRPYTKSAYYLFDIETMTLSEKPVLESQWINDIIWSPDSKKWLLLGGASAFDGLGKNLEKDVIPNDYDIQAYIFDLDSKKAEPITKQFDPSIDSAYWSPLQNIIYFRVTDQSDDAVYSYSPLKKVYKRLDTKINVVSQIEFAEKKNIAVYRGSSANVPEKLYKLDLDSGKAMLLKDYNAEQFKYVKIGEVKDWNFKTSTGKTITGHIHYPPDFDPTKKYPCIVNYYGGTSPVSKDFGGRYPKDWYCAHGYVVYILQPSGAYGFGQNFSAVHVNDWGKVTSEEVIEGVKQLIKEHPYIDPRRIGAIGASYGGFLTMYIAAQTDIFAAFISHAGISALSSYWGVGDWGYSYSGVATADSFPWNRKDIYVGQSPLFMADRVTKPILLLHGQIDNNVPPGESYQMFAALKLLGKEVELVTFPDQSHWILEYKKRLQWMWTIIAWYDKHLKNQPEYWNNLYPNNPAMDKEKEKNTGKKEEEKK